MDASSETGWQSGVEGADLGDFLDAGTVSISPEASVRFDQALWGVCCTCSPRHIVGEEMTGVDKTETDGTTYFCFLRKLRSSYGSRSFNSGYANRKFSITMQLQARRRAMSISTCVFSAFPIQPFPLYSNIQNQFMVAS